MRILIFIDNSGIKNVDCSDLTKGNPGIGGTEYCILLLAQVYKMYYPNEEVFLAATNDSKLPDVDEVCVCKHISDVPQLAKAKGCNILVVSSLFEGQPLSQDFFDQVERVQIKTITWGHNFYLSDYCKRLVNCEYVKANVFVGRQQYDRYIDHKVIRKSTYIYNMYPPKMTDGRQKTEKPVVTYIGSLVPMKGFQILAGAWKTIIEKVPDAELNIIGSGRLYSRNAQLGKYGIADQEFEDQIMPGLTDDSGCILPSVHYLGVMGSEKDEVIRNTSVGVVNPTGRTETFGISALDFESLGVPVVTIAKGGFLDTVIDKKTGILVKKPRQISDAIVSMLVDIEKNEAYGEAGRKLALEFRPEKIIDQWDKLFNDVNNDIDLNYMNPDSFTGTNLKWLRKFNRLIHAPIAVIDLETFVRNMLRRIGK